MMLSAPILVQLLLLCPLSTGVPQIDSESSAAPIEAPAQRASAAIAWYPTWDLGLAEARRSGRPILLQSAAPQCHGVPGMW